MVANLIMADNFYSLFNCTTISLSIYKMTAPYSVCCKKLAPSVSDLAHRGPVCGFLVFWLQIAIQPPGVCFFFFIKVFVIMCVSLQSFTDEVEDPYADRKRV